MSVVVGAILEGVVTGITSFGAFVKLPNGKTGLVHISEVADSYVEDINAHLKKEDTVKVKVLTIKDGGEKIGLSIRQASGDGASNRRKSPRPSRKAGPTEFEDVLSKFMKDSDQKLRDLKRSTDSKRGGRGTSRSV